MYKQIKNLDSDFWNEVDTDVDVAELTQEEYEGLIQLIDTVKIAVS